MQLRGDAASLKVMKWGRKHASPFLEANPEPWLHHTHGATQDRLMI